MSKNTVITVGRQLGSGGREVGKKLADKLGFSFYDREILTLAAEDSGFGKEFFENADEKVTPRFSNGFFSSPFPSLNSPSVHEINYLDNDVLFQIQSNVIRHISEKGAAIIVGRCADYILRDHPGLFSIFISASTNDRVKRLCDSLDCSPEEAIKTIKKADKQRSTYYNFYTDKTWGAASSYDLCINSSRFGIDRCVEIIMSLL